MPFIWFYGLLRRAPWHKKLEHWNRFGLYLEKKLAPKNPDEQLVGEEALEDIGLVVDMPGIDLHHSAKP